jgi:hypothetical protein
VRCWSRPGTTASGCAARPACRCCAAPHPSRRPRQARPAPPQPGGDRHADAALYRIVLVRLRYHQPTKDESTLARDQSSRPARRAGQGSSRWSRSNAPRPWPTRQDGARRWLPTAAELLSRQEAPEGGVPGRADDRLSPRHTKPDGRGSAWRWLRTRPTAGVPRQPNRAACDQRYCSRLGHASTSEMASASRATPRLIAGSPRPP